MYIYICIYIYVYIFICSMLYTSVLNASVYMSTCFLCLHASTNRYFGCRACMQTCYFVSGRVVGMDVEFVKLVYSGIYWRRIKVLGELKFVYFLRRLGGKASRRDAWGRGRREYYYRNSLFFFLWSFFFSRKREDDC